MESAKPIDPQWQRVPKAGESLEGLSRWSIYRAVKTGAVRFRSVKITPNGKRGVPYVSRADIRAMIENASSTETPVLS